jgi:Domain of unknown function (DUF4386)
MATTDPSTAVDSADGAQRTARIAGLWFIGTFVFSIPALLIYDPILNDTNYIVSGGHDTQVQFAALLEVLTAITGIATAVVLYRIVRRQNEALAIAYVAVRVVESTLIVVGVISLLSVVTLREDVGGGTAAGNDALINTGRALVAIKDWTFLFGPAFCAGLGNGVVLGYLMYRSGLVPRAWTWFGLIGGPLSVIGRQRCCSVPGIRHRAFRAS